MVTIIVDEVVERKKWLTNDEMMDALAIAQSTPGSTAVNTSIFIGYKLKGVKGAIICLIGTIIPAFIIILIVAVFFYKVRDNAILIKVFQGVRPAVVGLILSAVYKVMKKARFGFSALSESIATVFIIVFLKVNPIWIIIIGAISSVVINKLKLIKKDN